MPPTIDAINPGTGEPMDRFPRCGPEAVDAADNGSRIREMRRDAHIAAALLRDRHCLVVAL